MTIKQETQSSGFTRLIFGPYLEYVKRITPIFQLCLFLFLFSLGMGFIVGDSIPRTILEELLGSFPDVSDMSFLGLFGFIVINNVSKSLLFMLGGLLGAIPPVIFVIFNGFVLGWLAYQLSIQTSLGYVIAGLTPHGVIEIPAILLAMAVGMCLGYAFLNRLRGRGNLGIEVRIAMSFFITRILPLLVIAAIVEVTITPTIMVLLGYT